MNILLLCDEYPPGRHGGIGTFVQMLAHALQRQGHRVVVAGLYMHEYGGADRFDDDGVPVFRFRYGPSGLRPFATDFFGRLWTALWRYSGTAQRQVECALIRYGHQLGKLIEEYEIDLIEMPDFQGWMPFISRPLTMPELPVPVVVKLHGSLTYFSREAGEEPSSAVFECEWRILAQATAIASVSRYTARQTATYFGMPEFVNVLYNGIVIPPATPVQRAVPSLVVFTGTLVEKKGIFQLMKAWNLVHEQLPEARLQIFGKGPTAPAERLLSPSARNSVIFMGHRTREELLQSFRGASAAVFPSYAETFGLGPAEAMAAGTAVIFSTRTTGPELIRHMSDGLLCDPDDIEAIAVGIITLIVNPELRERLAGAGRASVASRFDIDRIAAEHVRFYKPLIRNVSES